MAKNSDPTTAIRNRAAKYAGVDEGTACTRASFKTGGKAFLFIGPQGGRFKAMFKLDQSKEEAKRLAAKSPDDFQAGSGPWVTARFSTDQPLPKSLWARWLDESHGIAAGGKPTTKKKTEKTEKTERTEKTEKTEKTAPPKRSPKKNGRIVHGNGCS